MELRVCDLPRDRDLLVWPACCEIVAVEELPAGRLEKVDVSAFRDRLLDLVRTREASEEDARGVAGVEDTVCLPRVREEDAMEESVKVDTVLRARVLLVVAPFSELESVVGLVTLVLDGGVEAVFLTSVRLLSAEDAVDPSELLVGESFRRLVREEIADVVVTVEFDADNGGKGGVVEESTLAGLRVLERVLILLVSEDSLEVVAPVRELVEDPRCLVLVFEIYGSPLNVADVVFNFVRPADAFMPERVGDRALVRFRAVSTLVVLAPSVKLELKVP